MKKVVTNRIQNLHKIRLDNPKSYHALNSEMVQDIFDSLRNAESSKITAVLLESSTPAKAFCAGGDVKAVLKADAIEKLRFFKQEYQLNHYISTFKKPVIIGGGVGVSFGSFRIATENTKFAMPEASIGLFPDVGASFFLSRLPLGFGKYLGLTGHSISGLEAKYSSHYILSDKIPLLTERLVQNEGSFDQVNAILNDFQELSVSDYVVPFDTSAFTLPKLENIISSLEEQKCLKSISGASPTSLRVIMEQLSRGKIQDLATNYRMEFRIVQKFLRGHDFAEGVTAKLVEKREPVWDKKSIADVSDADVDAFFKLSPLDSKERLEFYNPHTFVQYPFTTLSMPLLNHVEEVCKDQKVDTREKVLLAFESFWGGYDSNVFYNEGKKSTHKFQGKGFFTPAMKKRVLDILDIYYPEMK